VIKKRKVTESRSKKTRKSVLYERPETTEPAKSKGKSKKSDAMETEPTQSSGSQSSERKRRGRRASTGKSSAQVVEYLDSQQETSTFVVAFSGFMPGNSFDYPLRTQMGKQVEKLKGQVCWGDTFDSSITHVVTPPNCRTMKTLIARLTGRWLVTPDWIIDSATAGHWVDEKPYGLSVTEDLFKNKNVFISEDFVTENAKDYNAQNFKLLIEKLGRGKITTSAFNADLILVPSQIKHNYHTLGRCLSWKQFFNYIQPIQSTPRPSQES